MENSLTCDICNVNVRRASFLKHLRGKKTFRENNTG